MKAITLALLATVIATLGQLLLKFSMRQVGPVGRSDLSNPLPLLLEVFSNPLILIAIPLYVTGFLTWLIVLSKLDLSPCR